MEIKKIDSILKSRIAAWAIAFFSDKEEANITTFNMEVLIKEENNINYKEYITPGTSGLRRFLELFDDIFKLRFEANQWYCSLNSSSYVQARKAVFDLIRENGGRMLLAKIPSGLRDRYDIDYKLHSGKKTLANWLESDFGGIFEIHGYFCFAKTEIHDVISYALTDLIEANGGTISADEFASKLSSSFDIDYKDYAKNRSVTAWLSDEFSNDFIIDGDVISVSECEVVPLSKKVSREVAQLHSIAFMPLWIGGNLKLLHKYTGESRSNDEWTSIVARGFSRALLGETQLFCYTAEQRTKIVFNTGIKTEAGNSVFCVLKPNPSTSDLHPFFLDAFCCIAEDDTEICNEVKQNIPDILNSDNVLEKKYEELRNTLELLIDYQDKLRTSLPDLSSKINDGAAIDAETFNVLRAYYEKWHHARDIIEYLGWDTEGEAVMNLPALANRLEYKNRKFDVLSRAVEMFVDFAEAVSAYCKSNLLEKMSEVIEKDIEIAKNASLEHYSEFKDLLVYYTELMEITEYDAGKLFELADSIVFINEHFASVLSINIVKLAFLKKSADEMAIGRKSVPNDVLSLLSQLDAISLTEEEMREYSDINCDELFNIAINSCNSETLARLLISVSALYRTKLENAIVTGNFDKCRALITSDEAHDIANKSQEALLTAVDAEEKNATVLTLYECGKRLFNILGNHNRCAEKYFIAGLRTEPDSCAAALMDLYASENETESFFAIWDKFGRNLSLSAENTKFLLYTLCLKGEDALKEYLKKNICVLYVAEYATSLIATLNEFNYTELSDMCKARIAHISSATELNALEAQILQMKNNSDASKVSEFAGSSSLAELGYTDDEAESIVSSLISYETSDDTSTPLLRLYDVQGNKNGTAEKLLWEAVCDEFNADNCVILLKILVSENRYDEVCDLFECYESTLIKSSAAREAYIKALIHTKATPLFSFVKDNMQDCLKLLLSGELSGNDFKNTACEKINDVTFHLGDDVIQSIVVLSDNLRDIATNTVKLSDFGLNTEQIESFVSVYRTDSFSRDRDILSLAERLYVFLGACDAAKDFAQLALECGFDAVGLLWKIYSDTNNSDAMLELLSANPKIREGKENEYCALLFSKNEYEKFLYEATLLNSKNPELIIQIAIAKCHLGKSISDELSRLSGDISDVPTGLLNGLISVMAENGLVCDAKNFLVEHFNELISTHSSSELENIITANGKLSADELKNMQKLASESDFKKFVVYIYETFGIGRFKAASKKFLDEALSQPADKQIFDHLKTIYAKNEDFLVKIILGELTNIIKSSSDKAEASEKIENAMDAGIPLTADGTLTIISLLKEYELPVTNKICTNIISMCKASQINKECLEFFNSIPSFYSLNHSTEVLYMLCDMHKACVLQHSFNEGWIKNAITICTKLIDTEYFYDAEYCMYLIQKSVGNLSFAKFNLLSLLDKKRESQAEFLPEIEAEAEKLHLSEDTSIFDLFIEMAENSEISEIIEYCEYCSNFIHDKKALTEYYKENFGDMMADSYPDDSHTILLRLLYSNPKNGEYWYHSANMSFGEHPGVYTKLLYTASKLTNSVKIWNECIDACERHSQEDLLMDVLTDYAKNASMPKGLSSLRELLAKKVNANPLYFSALDSSRFAELVSIICERMKGDDGIRGNHSALKDLSSIAIATNSKEAYDIMLDYAAEYVFGENCNLGFAIACKLIQAKRLTEAKLAIERLSTIASLKYKNLISRLAAMSIDELAAWSSETINTELLDMILPDGNYPNIDTINTFALMHTADDKAETGAMLICDLLDDKPGDYGYYMALFILCKQLPNRIDLLHKALCGLVENKPGNSRVFYTRSKKDLAIALANLNAVVMSRGINAQISAFDGYDFTKSTWEYYQKFEGSIEDLSELNEIQEAYEKILNALEHRPDEIAELIYKLVFGYVTGNWCEFIKQCWEMRANMAPYLDYYSSFDNGMTRSVLCVAYSLPDSERKAFIEWIEHSGTPACNAQFNTAVSVYKSGYYENIPHDIFEVNILKLPFEENSVFDHVFANTISQLYSKAPNFIYPYAMIVGNLAGATNAMGELYKHAMNAFEASNDGIANKLFAAMNDLCRKKQIFHMGAGNIHKAYEIYEAMMRITGVFSGNGDAIEAVSKNNFNPWSCIHMVFALLYTKRANEVSRLKQYFSYDNQCLTDVILTIINKNVSDADKLNAINSLYDELSRGIVYFVVRMWDTANKRYAFISDPVCREKAGDELKVIAANLPKHFNTIPSPYHYIWVEPSKINKNAYIQLEVTTEKTNFEVVDVVDVSVADAISSDKKLSIVSDLEPLSSNESIDALWDEHEAIHSFGAENYKLRLDISKKIYRLALARDTDAALLNDYAIRYGVDYYYYCMGNKGWSAANSIMLELVLACDVSSSLEGARMLKSTVRSTALHELLHRGYTNISFMVEDYLKNKQAFIKMRNMLPVSEKTVSAILSDVNCVYTALEIIAKASVETSDSHISAYKSALMKAERQISPQGTQGWPMVINSVLKMIHDEIIKISRRAKLEVKILSKTAQMCNGLIYGQVKNMGNETAENITLQFSYDNGFESNIYELPRLDKEEIAVFEIYYSSKPETTKLNYKIFLSYESRGEVYPEVLDASLDITERSFVDFETNLYLTDKPISDFKLLPDGTVYSENFYGRDKEMRDIRSVFSGENFSDYKNIIIKGLKRAGKSSVLNYMLRYGEFKCDNAVTIYIDCLGAARNNSPIYRKLVEAVITECKRKNVGNVSEEEWATFERKYALSETQSDFDAEKLQLFYRDLKELNGKGLMLIIDEFDVLTDAIGEEDQGIDNTLFASLRTLCNSPYCQDAVHLAICGATNLIRYMDGGRFNQFFMQFGENNIEIGRLSEAEMRAMLITPYERSGQKVEFTNEAMAMIWKITNGLVWYSKLIASNALKRAHKKERNIIYPSDVVDAITSVTSNAEQLKILAESCLDKERPVVLALQSLSAKPTEYVRVSQLLELLSDKFSQSEIESILTTLVKMQILERNPFDRYSYRFEVELYWYYFRTLPSDFERRAEIPIKFDEVKAQQPTQNNESRFDR